MVNSGVIMLISDVAGTGTESERFRSGSGLNEPELMIIDVDRPLGQGWSPGYLGEPNFDFFGLGYGTPGQLGYAKKFTS